MYQRVKDRTETPARRLKLSKVPEKLWIYLTVDFITKLLSVVGKDVILVICNRLFKIIYFIAMIERTLAKYLARLFKDNV